MKNKTLLLLHKLNCFTKNTIQFWTFSVVFLFLQSVLPFAVFISLFFFLLTLIALFLNKEEYNFNKKNIYRFFLKTKIYSILLLIFILYYILDIKNNNIHLLKESLYGIYIFMIIFQMYLLQNVKNFYSRFNKYFIYSFLSIITIILISKLTNLYSVTLKEFDYNYFSLSLLIAFFIVFYSQHKEKNLWKIGIASLVLILISLEILFSGSRRGIVALIFVHLLLLFYFFYKFKNLIVSIFSSYFLLITSIITLALFISFGNSSATYSYIIKHYLPFNKQHIKYEITSIAYRYSTLYGKNSDYKKLYKKLWEPDPFKGKGLINEYIYQKELKKLNLSIAQNKFDKAFKKLCDICYFSDNKDKLKKDLPEIYKKIDFSNIFIESEGLKIVPFIFNIPFEESNHLNFLNIDNLYLTKPVSRKNYEFNFTTKNRDIDLSTISSAIYIIPNSKYTFTLKYKGINKDSLDFLFINLSNKKLNFIQEDIRLNNTWHLRKIFIKSDSVNFGLFKWNILINNIKDAFVLKSINYVRKPISDINYYTANIKDIKNYIRIQNRKINQFNEAYQKFIFTKDSLNISQKNNLKNFIKNINYFPINIRNYGTSSFQNKNEIISSGDNSFCFAYFTVPGLNTGIYEISLSIKTKKKPVIYINRMPEASPHFLEKRYIKREIIKKDSIYIFKLKYEIINSSTGLVNIKFGLLNASKNEKINVQNVKFKQLELNDTAATAYQYLFLKKYFAQTKNIKKIKLKKINTFDELINSLKYRNNFTDSRIKRWKFAYQYFNSLPLYKKTFGDGYNYTKIFPQIFTKAGGEEISFDYPHNPIISTFLYSGVIGGLFYINFLILSFYYYIKYRKVIGLFFILYTFTFFFMMFSGNSHFSVPIFTILSLIPFIAKYELSKK